MHCKFSRSTLVLPVLLLAASLPLAAEPVTLSEPPDGSRITTQVIVEAELPRPIIITSAGDGSNRLFVGLQAGIIRVIEDRQLLDEPFLDLTDKVTHFDTLYSEQGLIGLTFHPDYEHNGRFFVNYTTLTDGLAIEEYHVSADNPNVADPSTARPIMVDSADSKEHSGGQLAFGPDGYLYIGIGDRSGPGDPGHQSQDLNLLHGKILRINVEDETRPYRLIRENPYVGLGRPEIWAYGLRNPYTFSFDPLSGDMYIGDVGQETWEEVNFIAADDKDGANFGWSRMEGNELYNRDIPPKEDMEAPALTYQHAQDRCAVISGYVYHGKLFPEFEGVYLFSDWCASALLSLYKNEDAAWESTELYFFDGISGITGMGEDEDGELYVTYYLLTTGGGGVFKVVPNNTGS